MSKFVTGMFSPGTFNMFASGSGGYSIFQAKGPKDWSEVKNPYQERCWTCESLFWGVKNMPVCKECAAKNNVEVSNQKS